MGSEHESILTWFKLLGIGVECLVSIGAATSLLTLMEDHYRHCADPQCHVAAMRWSWAEQQARGHQMLRESREGGVNGDEV